MRLHAVLRLALGAVLLPGLLRAQQRLSGSLGVDGGSVWEREDAGGQAATARGPAIRGEASGGLGVLVLGLDLLEAHLLAPSGGPASDLVQGTVWAGVRPWPWLELSAARRIRAFVTDTATERWGTWQGRVRVGGPILGPWLDSYAALWWGTAPQGAGGSARGGQVSVVVAPGALVSFKLSYSLDQVELPGGSGFAIGPVQLGGGSSASQEIVEQLSVGAVLNLR